MSSPIDLRLGRWQDALADVTTCDAVICDPPYSARTHEGQRTTDAPTPTKHHRKAIAYDAWTTDDVRHFVASWAPRTAGWMVCFTSHDLCPAYADAMDDAGRYVFAPLPWMNEGGPIRLSGDGPSSWTCWIVVSRPRTQQMQRWGALPGGYHNDSRKDPAMANRGGILGAKPLGLMQAIVRDYSRPGDLVVDPFCGSGTTALACAMEGRRCITSEEKPEHYEIAARRLGRHYQPALFT